MPHTDELKRRDFYLLQMRSHFEDATKAGKPVVLGEFGKLHYGGMHQRRDFLELVYAEVEAWNLVHHNVAGPPPPPLPRLLLGPWRKMHNGLEEKCHGKSSCLKNHIKGLEM